MNRFATTLLSMLLVSNASVHTTSQQRPEHPPTERFRPSGDNEAVQPRTYQVPPPLVDPRDRTPSTRDPQQEHSTLIPTIRTTAHQGRR